MGRGAYSFCPRESMPMPFIDAKDSVRGKPIDTPTMLSQDAMTWQQEQTFGHFKQNRRRHNQKWRPFDQAAIEDISGSTDAWAAQKAEILPLVPGNYKAPATSSHHLVEQSAPTEASTSVSTYIQKDSTKKPASTHKPKKRGRNGNMTALPQSAYIPPNRRKLDSTNEAKLDPAHVAAQGTPVGSDKSKTHPLTQLHSSPETAKLSPSSPLSPPTTAPEAEKFGWQKPKPVSPTTAQQDNAEWAGWDKPKADASLPIRKNNNPRWPRGPMPAPKKTIWPKSRDMKYIPGNTDSDGGVSFKSNSNGDPNYDVKKLLDWNGDWLPPPEQWSARKGYTNRHFGKGIELWIDGHPEECCYGIALHPDAYRGRKTIKTDGEVQHILVDDTCKEIAPRYWMTATVEGKSLGEFWKEFPDRSPEALTDVDITDVPWWSRYEDSRTCFIDGLAVPEAVADPEDPENCINPCGFAPAEQKVQEMFARAERRKRKQIARRTQPIPEPKVLPPPVEDKRIRPTANVYFRPVQPADVRGITEIYNHYVENSIYANEFDGRTESQIRERINIITTQGLPYLVAIAKSNQINKQQGYISEKIVGYINLDDYCDQSSMYRYTFEMELFIHPGYTHKHIAKCLLDRLLEMSNTGYNARGGYEYVNEYDYLKNGPARVIKTILLNVHHKHGEDMKWASEYLSAFKFVRAGHISHVGFKHDHIVDISIFQHHTTEPINAGGIPTVPLERN